MPTNVRDRNWPHLEIKPDGNPNRYKVTVRFAYAPIEPQPNQNRNIFGTIPSEGLSSYRFQVLLTLFSEFFSTFAHATCLLSVSLKYLVLDGTYHPL